jgi:DNA invertase Pin-like site-specific DNA recombinase
VRVTDDELDAQKQLEVIQQYCFEHGYRIARAFKDKGKPSFGLAEALEALPQVDGLIAVDLNRFVEHQDDRLRDLRPFIHHFFCHTNKHLIAVEEGIDTRATARQRSAIEIINQVRDMP